MTLADQVKHNVRAKTIVEKGTAFEYYYYQLKIMVESDILLNTGEVIHFNRTKLNGYSFSNAKAGSRWHACVYSRMSNNQDIHLTLLR